VKGDPAASIADQTLHLQQACRKTDAAARNNQYLRHRLMCEIESAIARPVNRTLGFFKAFVKNEMAGECGVESGMNE